MPDLAAARRIEGKRLVSSGHVHDVVSYHWRDFESSCIRDRKEPLRPEARHIAGMNLFQLAIAITAEAAVVGGPVAWLRIDQARKRYSRSQRFSGFRRLLFQASEPAQVSQQIPHLLGARLDRRHQRLLFAILLGDFAPTQQIQPSIQRLQL